MRPNLGDNRRWQVLLYWWEGRTGRKVVGSNPKFTLKVSVEDGPMKVTLPPFLFIYYKFELTNPFISLVVSMWNVSATHSILLLQRIEPWLPKSLNFQSAWVALQIISEVYLLRVNVWYDSNNLLLNQCSFSMVLQPRISMQKIVNNAIYSRSMQHPT